MLLNYEDANELCIRAAENIAQVLLEVVIYVLIASVYLGKHREEQKIGKLGHRYEFIQ